MTLQITRGRGVQMLLLLMSASAYGVPYSQATEVEQPRSFGHFVGDVLTQRIALDQGDRRVHLSSLPTADRVGLWFQRRPSRIETDAAGRHWLVVDYQVINSPLLPLSVALPALTLATDANAPVQVDSWPVYLSPLSAKPDYANSAPLAMRPDRMPMPLPTRVMERRLGAWSTGLAVVLCAWLVWYLWANRRDSMRLPFARALRQLCDRTSVDGDAAAWICMHRALNETAGRAIQGYSVGDLFASAPQLLPLQPELEDFYRRSSARFFGKSPVHTSFPLVDLCRQLRRIEKRTSRGRAVRS